MYAKLLEEFKNLEEGNNNLGVQLNNRNKENVAINEDLHKLEEMIQKERLDKMKEV